MKWLLLNGELLPEEAAFLPVKDSAIAFGDGVFTTLLVEQGVPHFFSAHLHRLFQHCSRLGMAIPKVDRKQIETLISRQEAQEGSWRLKILVTGGVDSGRDLKEGRQGSVIVTLDPFSRSSSPITVGRLPFPLCQPTAQMKTLSYLDRLLMKRWVKQQGWDDGWVTDHKGRVLETIFSNGFWIRGRDVFAPHPSLGLVAGIAWKQVKTLLSQQGFSILEGAFSFEEVQGELYICNALQGVLSVGEEKGAWREQLNGDFFQWGRLADSLLDPPFDSL